MNTTMLEKFEKNRKQAVKLGEDVMALLKGVDAGHELDVEIHASMSEVSAYTVKFCLWRLDGNWSWEIEFHGNAMAEHVARRVQALLDVEMAAGA